MPKKLLWIRVNDSISFEKYGYLVMGLTHCSYYNLSRRTPRPSPALCTMHGELITEGEFIGKLRRQRVTDVGRVQEAHVESDGQVSVVQRESKQREPERRKES